MARFASLGTCPLPGQVDNRPEARSLFPPLAFGWTASLLGRAATAITAVVPTTDRNRFSALIRCKPRVTERQAITIWKPQRTTPHHLHSTSKYHGRMMWSTNHVRHTACALCLAVPSPRWLPDSPPFLLPTPDRWKQNQVKDPVVTVSPLDRAREPCGFFGETSRNSLAGSAGSWSLILPRWHTNSCK